MQHASPYVTGYMKVMEKENTKKYLVILDNEDNGKVVVSVAPALTEYQKRRIEGTTQVGYAKNFLDYLYMFCNGMKDISQATLEQIYEFGTYLKEQGKSPDTIRQYAYLIDDIYDDLYIRHRIPEDSTLIRGTQSYLAMRPNKMQNEHYTLAGSVIKRVIGREKSTTPPMLSFNKNLTDEEIQLIKSYLNLRDKCIFSISVDTGYRISSVLSISFCIEAFEAGHVIETHSKTGRTHPATISLNTQKMLFDYIHGPRHDALKRVGVEDFPLLFLSVYGGQVHQLSYSTYYSAEKAAEKKIHAEHPDRYDLHIHSHAGRATYLNRIVQNGNMSDATLCSCMDWKSPAPLYHYYDMRSAKHYDEAHLYREAIMGEISDDHQAAG
ncbi:MAG: tyrosine-type recombinase/integrase [Candidatus Choladocola sp.]|nr:tyrosine-type recombinase/integrase [Candidatus Choladocola sp.]